MCAELPCLDGGRPVLRGRRTQLVVKAGALPGRCQPVVKTVGRDESGDGEVVVAARQAALDIEVPGPRLERGGIVIDHRLDGRPFRGVGQTASAGGALARPGRPPDGRVGEPAPAGRTVPGSQVGSERAVEYGQASPKARWASSARPRASRVTPHRLRLPARKAARPMLL